ncbi:hypothetical protein FACS189493_1440 [Spirochaetia bacterium]|nr:hypothetical protein FACS189493_1440 [Spirochaetia bacterium]
MPLPVTLTFSEPCAPGYRVMPKPAAGYSVSYNPTADTWAVYEGNKRIAVKESEPDAWRYIQHLAVMEQREAEKKRA